MWTCGCCVAWLPAHKTWLVDTVVVYASNEPGLVTRLTAHVAAELSVGLAVFKGYLYALGRRLLGLFLVFHHVIIVIVRC